MVVKYDALLVGGGHNGLTAALRLQQAGLNVLVVEQKATVGGASKTEYPFPLAPTQAASTGAYLLGLMPPEIPQRLGIAEKLFPLLSKREPHYFLPTKDHRHLLFGSDDEATIAEITRFFSAEDARAYCQMQTELAAIRDDIAPSWLVPPLPLEEIAQRCVRPILRQVFIDLCRGSVFDYLSRFGFKSKLLMMMFAVTDGISGLSGDIHKPGTGFNHLAHNMCRLPTSKGTWMRLQGGMGAVSEILETALLEAGGQIRTNVSVEKILVRETTVEGLQLSDGTEVLSDVVVVNADPFRMLTLLDESEVEPEYRARIEGYRTPGATLKLNLCMRARPEFTCLAGDFGQCNGTIHIIPDTEHPFELLAQNFLDAEAGRLPKRPVIEWYLDENLRDKNGNFSSALFVPAMPYSLSGTTWDKEIDSYGDLLLAICDEFAPGTSERVVDRFPLTPPGLQKHFGITMGHIHHVPNTFSYKDRLPYRTPIWGLYCAGAGCHPGGSVTGACGYISAGEVLHDLGKLSAL